MFDRWIKYKVSNEPTVVHFMDGPIMAATVFASVACGFGGLFPG